MNGATCCKEVWTGPRCFRAAPCGAAAKVERDGKPYCLRHDPVRIAERERSKKAEREARRDRLVNERRRVEDERAERDRRAACFPGLVAALTEIRIAAVDADLRASTHRVALERIAAKAASALREFQP